MANNETNKKINFLPILLGFGLTILLLGGFALIIKLDVGGLGSQVLAPVIEDVPVINYVLPASTTDETLTASGDGVETFLSLDEAIERLKATETLLDNSEEQVAILEEENQLLTREVERLQEFEERYEAFQNEKAAFDEEVVFNSNAPDISEYKMYYESIYPQNAEKIYQAVVEQEVYNAEAVTYARTFQEMKAGSAATILEEMSTDLDLVVLILENIDTEQRASILGEMTPRVAAKITKRMAP